MRSVTPRVVFRAAGATANVRSIRLASTGSAKTPASLEGFVEATRDVTPPTMRRSVIAYPGTRAILLPDVSSCPDLNATRTSTVEKATSVSTASAKTSTNVCTAEAHVDTAPSATTYRVASSVLAQAGLAATRTTSAVGKELRVALATTTAKTTRRATESPNNVTTFATNPASVAEAQNVAAFSTDPNAHAQAGCVETLTLNAPLPEAACTTTSAQVICSA